MSNLDDSIRNAEPTLGRFETNSELAQSIKFVMRRGQNWEKMHPSSKEAMECAATYISMILSGDAANEELWNNMAAVIRMRAKMLEPQKTAHEAGLATIDRALRVVEGDGA